MAHFKGQDGLFILYRQENPNGRGCFVRLINYIEYKLQSLPHSSINHEDLKANAQPNLKAKNKVNIFEESKNETALTPL